MSSPGFPPLQRLHYLDGHSPGFHDQLCDVLQWEEYVRCVPKLQGNEAIWLVDYLDKVRRYVALPALRSGHRRLSTVLILPALLTGSVCVS